MCQNILRTLGSTKTYKFLITPAIINSYITIRHFIYPSHSCHASLTFSSNTSACFFQTIPPTSLSHTAQSKQLTTIQLYSTVFELKVVESRPPDPQFDIIAGQGRLLGSISELCARDQAWMFWRTRDNRMLKSVSQLLQQKMIGPREKRWSNEQYSLVTTAWKVRFIWLRTVCTRKLWAE